MPTYEKDPVTSLSSSPDAPIVGNNTAPLPGGNGGWFESSEGEGVRGVSKNNNHGAVVGVNTAAGIGVFGTSVGGEGVRGSSKTDHGAVVGVNDGSGAGGWFESSEGEGVRGVSKNPNHGGVVGVNSAGGDAGYFAGNVGVTGNLTVQKDVFLTGADCAEEFEVAAASGVDPGTVLVMGAAGVLQCSQKPYDKRVAGVVSGAGDYVPALVLDRQRPSADRKPVALLGKVFCKVDADYGPIEIGDMLTTSGTPGHAMKAADPYQAFGAVIGKALRSFGTGQGMVPVLVSLQ